MCGRYVVAHATGDLVSALGAEPGVSYRERISYNVAPTTPVPVVLERLEGDEILRELHTARWGLLPRWAKDSKMAYKTFNARSETVTEKNSFRSAVASKRCAVPADAYYEWLKDGDQKRPHIVRPADGGLILFAGLYEWWKNPAAGEDAPWILTCTILTGYAPSTETNRNLHELHDRLPLALSKESATEWLRPGKLEKSEATELVDYVRSQAYEECRWWTVEEVGKAVGNARNDGAELAEPLNK